MIISASNDNRTPSLKAVDPDHTGFQTNWMDDRNVLKSMDFYEAYLVTKMRNKA